MKKIFYNFLSFFKKINEINKISKIKPRFIFYSENKSYLKYSYLLIKYLSKKFPGEVYYFSSDVNDKIKNLDVLNFYIGRGFLLQFFFKIINADNFFMTVTDLNNNNIIRKNSFVKNYIYFFHAAISTTRVYTSTAFDNYDTILCTSTHQIKEIQFREKIKNLKPKKLIKSGYFYFDYLSIKKNEETVIADEILLAPSWNKNKLNFINEDFEVILKSLLNLGYKVRFRPHPETIKRSYNLMNSYKEKFKSNNFIFDENSENFLSMNKAKCLITDNSGISIEYMMIFRKPVLFYGDFDKEHNEDFRIYKNLNLIEDNIKNTLGYKFKKDQITNLKKIIGEATNNFNEKKVQNFLNKNFYNVGKTINFFSDNINDICK